MPFCVCLGSGSFYLGRASHCSALFWSLDALFFGAPPVRPPAFRRVCGLESYSRTSEETNHHRQSVSDTRVTRYQLHHEDDSPRHPSAEGWARLGISRPNGRDRTAFQTLSFVGSATLSDKRCSRSQWDAITTNLWLRLCGVIEIRQYWQEMKVDVDQALEEVYEELHHWQWRRNHRGDWVIEPRR